MCFTPSLSSTQSVSFYTQFPRDLSSPSSPGGCRRAQHLLDIPDVKIHLFFRSDAFAGSCRPSPWPRRVRPLLPPLLPHGGHAALHGEGQWRKMIKPRLGRASLCVPSLWGGAEGGTWPCRPGAGPADMAAPGLGLGALHGAH